MCRHIKKANLWSIMWFGLLADRVERDNSKTVGTRGNWKAKKKVFIESQDWGKKIEWKLFLWKRSLARNLVACCFKTRFVSSKWLTEKSLCKCERMGFSEWFSLSVCDYLCVCVFLYLDVCMGVFGCMCVYVCMGVFVFGCGCWCV